MQNSEDTTIKWFIFFFKLFIYSEDTMIIFFISFNLKKKTIIKISKNIFKIKGFFFLPFNITSTCMQKCFGHVRHRHAEGFKVSRTWYTYIQIAQEPRQ